MVGPTHDPDYNLYVRAIGSFEKDQAEKGIPHHSAEAEQAKLEVAREVLEKIQTDRGNT
jgi:hypothetical protein